MLAAVTTFLKLVSSFLLFLQKTFKLKRTEVLQVNDMSQEGQEKTTSRRSKEQP